MTLTSQGKTGNISVLRQNVRSRLGTEKIRQYEELRFTRRGGKEAPIRAFHVLSIPGFSRNSTTTRDNRKDRYTMISDFLFRILDGNFVAYA